MDLEEQLILRAAFGFCGIGLPSYAANFDWLTQMMATKFANFHPSKYHWPHSVASSVLLGHSSSY